MLLAGFRFATSFPEGQAWTWHPDSSHLIDLVMEPFTDCPTSHGRRSVRVAVLNLKQLVLCTDCTLTTRSCSLCSNACLHDRLLGHTT